MIRSLVFGSLFLVFGAAAPADTPAAKAPADFVSLFNGKDLTGWTVTEGGNIKVWGADKGILYVQGGGGGWLMTKKEYSDFELRLQYKMSRHGNSGVALRSPLRGDAAYVGMEIQLIDDVHWKGLKEWQHTGAIYGVVPPAKIVNRPIGQWNDMRIVAKGRHVLVEHNGTRLVDANLDDHVAKHGKAHPGLLRKSGHVGLQSHNDRVEFRNIFLKTLAEGN